MVFSSLHFIYIFLPLFLAVYFLIPEGKKYSIPAKNLVLLAGSLYFYAYGEPVFVCLMLLSILVNYTLAALTERGGKVCFLLAVFFDLAVLIVFKYAFFFTHNLNLLFQAMGGGLTLPEVSLKNPVGVSFYTFQAISYVADVYKKRYPAEKNFLHMAVYISMFPQLIAGPIVTYPTVRDALSARSVTAKAFDEGVKLFILGLCAKVLIANRIGILWTDIGRIGYESISPILAWMGAFAYSFQIYFDFYGYSLMAVGLGKMLGFLLPANFNDPYVSSSVTEFWRRWHMTLGAWFKEYVYIPLGGSREGKLKTVQNIFLVWLLTGLWHGASWNFVIWGMLFFVLLMAERGGLKKVLDGHRGLSALYMLFVIPVSWVIFAIPNISQLCIYLTRLFPFLPVDYASNVNPDDYIKFASVYGVSFLTAVVFCVPKVKSFFHGHLKGVFGDFVYVLLFFLSVYFLSQGLNNPFLYYRF